MGEEYYEGRIGSRLGGIAGGTAEGAFTTGSFAFDEDTLRDLIKDWQALADSYLDSLESAEAMTVVVPPADDFASEAQAAAAGRSGQAYYAYLQHNRDYCLEQADLFQAALDDYLGVEDAIVTEIDKTERQPGI